MSRAKTILVLYLVCLAVMHICIGWKLRSRILDGFGDFSAFYTAGKIVQQGDSGNLYNPDTQWRVQQGFASKVSIRQGPLPFVRPPFQSLMFLPLAYLSFQSACVVWLVFNIALLVWIPFLISRAFFLEPVFPDWLMGLLSLGLFPVADGLINGQDSIILLFLLTLAFICLHRGSNLQCGILLGLCLFKFHFAIPIALVFLLHRNYKFFVAFCSTGAALVVISARLIGWKGLWNYPAYLWRLDHRVGIGFVTWQAMPNLRAVFRAILGNTVAAPYLSLIAVIVVLAGAGFTAVLWNSAVGIRDSLGIGFSLTVVVTLLASYYAYSYDMTLLLLPMFTQGTRMWESSALPSWTRHSFRISVTLLLLSPLHWFLAFMTDWYFIIGVAILFFMTLSFAGAMIACAPLHPKTASDQSLFKDMNGIDHR